MKYIMFFVFFTVCSSVAFCQSKVSQNGTVTIPVLQSVEATYISNNTNLRLDDLQNGKIIENYCQVTVKSNVPWRISVKTDDNSISDATHANVIASNKIFVKPHNKTNFIPLSRNAVILNESNDNKILNVFGVDVKIDADYTVKGGNYPLALIFTVSTQ